MITVKIHGFDSQCNGQEIFWFDEKIQKLNVNVLANKNGIYGEMFI